MVGTAFILLTLIGSVASFAPSSRFLGAVRQSKPLCSQAPGLDDTIRAKIDKLIAENKVILFMKGNKLFPQCGFSNTACRILDAIKADYETVNVLEDEKIRNGIKVNSHEIKVFAHVRLFLFHLVVRCIHLGPQSPNYTLQENS